MPERQYQHARVTMWPLPPKKRWGWGQNPNKRTVFFTWLKRICYIFQPWGTVHLDFIAFLGLGRRPKTRNAIKSKCTVPQGWAKHAQIVTFPKNVALIGILTRLPERLFAPIKNSLTSLVDPTPNQT